MLHFRNYKICQSINEGGKCGGCPPLQDSSDHGVGAGEQAFASVALKSTGVPVKSADQHCIYQMDALEVQCADACKNVELSVDIRFPINAETSEKVCAAVSEGLNRQGP